MNCPVCKKVMTEEDFGVKVDVCRDGCKGIWFDCGELSKLDEKNEGFGAALQEALHFPRVNDEKRGIIQCPKCNEPMHRHLFSSNKEVNVDECYDCGGFFLDSGELKEIRDHHMTAKEETAYAQKLLANLPDYQDALQHQAKNKIRAEALRRFTRLLRLSYYATGK